MTKWLVITGGSRGIGKETAKQFLEHGYKVLNLSRTPCPLSDVENLPIDLTKTESIEQHKSKLQSTVKDASSICLVHNAALFPADRIDSIDQAALQSVLNVNIVAPMLLNTVLIPFMLRHSSIIYIGSTLSEMAVPGRASYVMTKHAFVGLMRSTCQDLAAKQIHTCCICPGFVNTEMVTKTIDNALLKQLVEAKVIAKRMLEPEEIAELIYFAATHPMVNGSVLHANLGQVTS